jgi:hypothetical protein
VIYRPVTLGMRRRTWRRTRRGRPPCREPGPHDSTVLSYEQPQQISTVAGSPAGPAVTFAKASSNGVFLLALLRAGLTPAARGATIACASTSLGEASARIQATDLERRETPRVRTAPPGLRVEPKWLPEFPDTPCSAKALTRGVPRPGPFAGSASSHVQRDGTPVCPGREEVRRNES